MRITTDACFTEQQKEFFEAYSKYQAFLEKNPKPHLGYRPLSDEAIAFDMHHKRLREITDHSALMNICVQSGIQNLDYKNPIHRDLLIPEIVSYNQSGYLRHLSVDDYARVIKKKIERIHDSSESVSEIVGTSSTIASTVKWHPIHAVHIALKTLMSKPTKLNVADVQACPEYWTTTESAALSKEYFTEDAKAMTSFFNMNELGKKIAQIERRIKIQAQGAAGTNQPHSAQSTASADAHQDFFNSDELIELPPQFVDAFKTGILESTSIDGFEREYNVIAIYDQLKEKINNGSPLDDVIRVKTELDFTKSKIWAQRQEFDKSIQHCRHGVSMASSLAFIFGNAQLAHQFDLGGRAAVDIGRAMAGIAGYGLLSADPMAIGSTLLSGVASLCGLLRKQKSPPSLVSILAPMLQTISQQISQLRQEMHERFDQVTEKLNELQRHFLTSFMALSRETKLTQDMVLHLLNRAGRLEEKQDAGFSSMHTRFDHMQSQLSTMEMESVWSRIMALKPKAYAENITHHDENFRTLLTGFDVLQAYAPAIVGKSFETITAEELKTRGAMMLSSTLFSAMTQFNDEVPFFSIRKMEALSDSYNRIADAKAHRVHCFHPLDALSLTSTEKRDFYNNSQQPAFSSLINLMTQHMQRYERMLFPVMINNEWGLVIFDSQSKQITCFNAHVYNLIDVKNIPGATKHLTASMSHLSSFQQGLVVAQLLSEAVNHDINYDFRPIISRLRDEHDLHLRSVHSDDVEAYYHRIKADFLESLRELAVREDDTPGNPVAIAYVITLLGTFIEVHHKRAQDSYTDMKYDEIALLQNNFEKHIEPLRHLITAIRQPALWHQLFSAYLMHTEQFGIEVDRYLTGEMSTHAITEDLRSRSQFNVRSLSQPTDRDKFVSQDVPVGVNYFNWTAASGVQSWKYNKHGHHYACSDITWRQGYANAYIAREKNAYLAEVKSNVIEFSIQYEGTSFIYSADPGLSLLLPMASRVDDSIPNKVRYLQDKSKVKVAYFHRLCNDTNCLEIVGKVLFDNGLTETFFSKSFQNHLFYRGEEAIWPLWVGGKMPMTLEMESKSDNSQQSDGRAKFFNSWNKPKFGNLPPLYQTADFGDPRDQVPLSRDFEKLYHDTLQQDVLQSEAYHQSLQRACLDSSTVLGKAYESLNKMTYLMKRALEFIEQISPTDIFQSNLLHEMQVLLSAEVIILNARNKKTDVLQSLPDIDDVIAFHEKIIENMQLQQHQTRLFFEDTLSAYANTVVACANTAEPAVGIEMKQQFGANAFSTLEAVAIYGKKLVEMVRTGEITAAQYVDMTATGFDLVMHHAESLQLFISGRMTFAALEQQTGNMPRFLSAPSAVGQTPVSSMGLFASGQHQQNMNAPNQTSVAGVNP